MQKQHHSGHMITGIQAGSIAGELGLQPGDSLLLIDGKPLQDVFDYRMRQITETLVLTIRKADGETIEFDIEKDEDEDLGMEFANPLMADCSDCENHCLFCFIDQLPAGLRSTLYFKDDDLRLSFLTGNYVTLTNLSDDDLDRLIAYRLSPMNISVHTTDPKLRQRMMRHPRAGLILERLQKITQAGIAVNAQIVLCPGINDGGQLHRTISDLIALGPAVHSIAVVPVGLTRYRETNGLYPLRPLSADDAAGIIREIDAWQAVQLHDRQERLVYAADEIYLKAGVPLPPAASYEGFPQLENGVGMASLMQEELTVGLRSLERQPIEPHWSVKPSSDHIVQDKAAPVPCRTVVLVTGTAAAPLLQPFMQALSERSGLDIRLVSVQNRFFGPLVTVAGLLTGQDILAAVQPVLDSLTSENKPRCIVLPDCLLRSGDDHLLDDYSLQQLADQLRTAIHVCPAHAAGLLGLVDWLSRNAPADAATPGRRNQL